MTTGEQTPDTAPGARPPGRGGPRTGGGLLGIVTPNSRTHWTLLVLGSAAGIAFNAVVFVGGAVRPGYDAVAQPMSALSLGPDGWVQVTNFVLFGIAGCVTAFAWRPTLAPGPGAVWYPRLRVLAAVALIGAGLFSQDPGRGFPAGVAAPPIPTLHQQIHNVVSYVSLTTTVAELLILAHRFRREGPAWRGWATAATTAALSMMVFLATFGILIADDGPGGIFEKLASLTPTLFGIALVAQLLIRRDARITGSPRGRPPGAEGVEMPR